VVASTGSLEALNYVEIDAEYDDDAVVTSRTTMAGGGEAPRSLNVTPCYGEGGENGLGGSSGPVSLPIAAFGRRIRENKKYDEYNHSSEAMGRVGSTTLGEKK
jgi:hypothetical protein